VIDEAISLRSNPDVNWLKNAALTATGEIWRSPRASSGSSVVDDAVSRRISSRIDCAAK